MAASFVGAPIAVLSRCNGSNAKRLTAGGVSPFAMIHAKGERFTRSAECTSAFPHLLLPCWTTILNILQRVEEHEKAKKNLPLVVDFRRAPSTKRWNRGQTQPLSTSYEEHTRCK